MRTSDKLLILLSKLYDFLGSSKVEFSLRWLGGELEQECKTWWCCIDISTNPFHAVTL